jgi:hypothetical protein
MNERTRFGLLFLLGFVLGAVLIATDARAQNSGAGNQNQAGPYTVTSSIEVGVRGKSIDGNYNKFRSDLDYQPGFRLFDSSFLMKSNGNDGAILFDNLLVTSSGWGGDPGAFLRVNADKTKYYRFDATVRRVDYFNNLTNLALNQHTANTQHTMGDFDLTFLPQNERIKFSVGYSMDRGSGSAFTTYDYGGDEYPVSSPVLSESNDYRVGVEVRLGPLDLSFQQGFRYFKDDTTYTVTTPQIGNNVANASVLNTFHRDFPTRGRIPYTRFSLHSLVAKKLDFTGRFVYSSATTRFSMFEQLTGVSSCPRPTPAGCVADNVILDTFTSSGTTKRPNGLGDIGVTFLATDKLRISDTVRINAFHIDGGDRLAEALLRTRRTTSGATVPIPPTFTDALSFRTTSYRRAINTIEVDYDFHRSFSAHVGHRYTDRRIELNGLDLNLALPAPAPGDPEEFDNRTNTYFWGFRARPVKMWTTYFDFEKGASDNVFTRIDNYDFTNVRVRSVLRPNPRLAINMSLVSKDNANPSIADAITRQDFGADVNSRVYTASVDWSPNTRFWLDTGYTHTHLTSDAVIVFFAPAPGTTTPSLRTVGLSRYFVRDEFAFLNTSIQLHPRASLYAGYRIHRDRGQGDRVSSPSVLIGSYPMQFSSPEFRFAVRLHDSVDWNVGYQYFDFKERFVNRQFYQAHLPYTSLRIYFGRGKG